MNTEQNKPIPLVGKAARYMFVPVEIVAEYNNGKWLTAMYVYSQVRAGLDDVATISIKKAVTWLGKKQSYSDRGVNANLTAALRTLIDFGYINTTDDKSEFIVNPEQRNGRDHFKRYTVLYLDEVERIINYCKENKENHVEKILLLFAYYRISIYKRQKEYYDIAEMYNDHFVNIAKNTFMTIDTVRWATRILDKLNLIKYYTPEPNRLGEDWATGKSIFVNYERRSGNMLLAGGDDYYKCEIKKAMEQLERAAG